jgi:hypothetical protein
MVLDCALQLLDVLGSTLAKGSLGLPVALLALFRGSIDGFATAFALLLLRVLLGICLRLARLRGVFDRRRRTLARVLCFAHGGRHSCYAIISHLRPPYPSYLGEGHRSAKK